MLQAYADGHDWHTIHREVHGHDAVVKSRNDGKKHLLLAATGSVATIKIPEIIKSLSHHSPGTLSIRVVFTKTAQHFLAGQSKEQPLGSSLLHLPNVDGVYDDDSEWGPGREPWKRGRPILHIELRKWADILVIAPLSMDGLAKIVHGQADSLLYSLVRAWDTDGTVDNAGIKRIIVAPAANTAMWKHPITSQQIRILEEEWGADNASKSGWFEVLRPQDDKTLACGDVGIGAMKDWREIVKVIEDRLGLVANAGQQYGAAKA